ncbi:terpenoid synthase [Aspergillus ibericus CBS 121593]|uniref:Terpenoid synthase n=1 Tax=Aspergillus ibericus CBS 121593 TaxID=1448316 RepID=A0A395H0B0_9EURO|nr:terpenoid synthase [Aspergillus ibericus CBS 121593]RAL00779.1 terpenoid synthase [Aspergillus ibericus CBS 121593]
MDDQIPPIMSTSAQPERFFTLVSSFLKNVFLSIPKVPDDEPFDAEVLNHFKLSGLPSDDVHKYSKAAGFIARCFYPHLNRETQLSIGVWTAYIFSMDDLCEGTEFREKLKNHRDYMFGNRHAQWAFLDGFFSSLHDLCGRYEPFVGDMITKSSLDYLSVNVLEVEQNGKFKVDSNTRLFPAFLRQKSAIGEAYAFANFPKGAFDIASYITMIPDLTLVVGHLNDVVSFYKESIVGDEQDTTMMLVSAVEGCSAYETLEKTVGQCLDSIQRMRATCVGNEDLQNVVNNFVQGFAFYHLKLPRYHLEDFGDYREWLSK